jgi:hypothetical protein
MFRVLTLLCMAIMAYEAQGATIDQELSSCSAAWAAAKNKDFVKAVNLADPKKCSLTHGFMTWKKLRSDKITSSFGEYTNFISHHEDWPWKPTLLIKAGKGYQP